MYEWIFFDADDTLFDFKKSSRHALSRTLAAFDINPPEDFQQIYRAINAEVWQSFERKEITARELRLVRFERFLTVIGEYRDPHELSTYYLKELSGIGFLLDGARTLLEDLLDRGHRLCLITNGLKEVQRSRIAAARMEPYFEAIVISDEIGTAKPHAGFFQYAFSAIGHPDKEKVVVVGDSLSSDIQGGNNFGLATCWFNPDGRDNITAHRPDYEIKNLEEILPIVGF